MSETRLVPMTRGQRNALTLRRLGITGDNRLAALQRAYDANPEPVTRRRCSTHNAEESRFPGECWIGRYGGWVASDDRWNPPVLPCVFVDELCVPRPEAAS